MSRQTLLSAALACVTFVVPSADAQFETRANFPTYHLNGFDPYSVVVGDFNRDGALDLALVGSDLSGSVEILLGNGDGTFRQGSNYAVGVGPAYGATASLRNNEILDLVPRHSHQRWRH
jgi:hypothetical protein